MYNVRYRLCGVNWKGEYFIIFLVVVVVGGGGGGDGDVVIVVGCDIKRSVKR